MELGGTWANINFTI